VTDFKEFAGRTHYTIIGGRHGWEEVADYVIEWARRVTGAAGSSRATPGHEVAS
jgi:hypothetical protein